MRSQVKRYALASSCHFSRTVIFLGLILTFIHLYWKGGGDEYGNFIHIPILDLTEMKECFRQLVINHFKDTGRITDKIASNLLSWKHSGFNINNSIRIMGHDNKSREALCSIYHTMPCILEEDFLWLIFLSLWFAKNHYVNLLLSTVRSPTD